MGIPVPMSLQMIDGNKNRRSKKVIKERLEHEKKMIFGGPITKPTEQILKREYAIKKWNELVSLYKDVEFINKIDAGALEQYCLLHADYYELLDLRESIINKGWDEIKTYHALQELKIDFNINRKIELMLKLEDRLLLNPTSRIRAIPRREPVKEKTYLESVGLEMV